MSRLQRVELCTFYDANIHCPFCGQKVVDYGTEGIEAGIAPCLHTLFCASDEGFEYRSPQFNEFFNLENDDDEVDLDALGFEHIDAMTDAYETVDGIKFAQYVAPPGSLGGYVGFAPIESDAD